MAARWRSWNDSPPLRRASVLPRSATWNEYDLLFLISKLASAAAPAREDCPHLAQSHRRASRHSPPPSFCPLDHSFSALLIPSHDQQHNSKPIASQCQSGSLQVAVSKTLRPSAFTPRLGRIPPERFRYSPRTCLPRPAGRRRTESTERNSGRAAFLLHETDTRFCAVPDPTDLVVGAVLIPGASAPRLVRREMIAKMKRGAVVVDVAIDQGGCFETSHVR